MLRIDEQGRRLISLSGGRALMILGLVFASFGALFVYLILNDTGVTVNDRPARPGDAWLPILMVVIGLAMAFSRYQRVFDLRRKEVFTTFSCVVTFYRRSEPLSALVKVSLSREVRRSNKKKRTYYPVHLVTRAKNHELSSGQNELKARREAETAARFTELDLSDTTGGQELVRSPEELDLPLLAREEDDGSWVSKPADSRIEVQSHVSGSIIRIPIGGKYLYARWAPLLVLPILFGFFYLEIFDEFRGMELSDFLGQWTDYLPQLLFMVLPTLFVIGMVLASNMRPRILNVDKRGVRMRQVFGSVSIPVSELEELRISTAPTCLLARSDTRQFRCGYGLSQEELSFLRHAILRGLRGQF